MTKRDAGCLPSAGDARCASLAANARARARQVRVSLQRSPPHSDGARGALAVAATMTAGSGSRRRPTERAKRQTAIATAQRLAPTAAVGGVQLFISSSSPSVAAAAAAAASDGSGGGVVSGNLPASITAAASKRACERVGADASQRAAATCEESSLARALGLPLAAHERRRRCDQRCVLLRSRSIGLIGGCGNCLMVERWPREARL